MIVLLAQVQLWSLKNRILSRIRRLKQIRYLIGALAGVAWFLGMARPWRIARVAREGRFVDLTEPSTLLAVEIGIGAVLTLVAIAAWILPRRKAALEFTEPEVAVLFTAPLTRRQVVDFSLLKGQPGLLFGVLIVSQVGLRAFAPSSLFAFAGIWIVFTVLQLYFLASGIVRASLFRHGLAGWRRAWPILSTALVVITAFYFWIPPLDTAGGEAGPREILEHLAHSADSGPLGWILWPGRALIRPVFAADALGFLKAVLPALAILIAAYFWVIRSDFAYEESSAELAERSAKRREHRHTRRARYEWVAEGRRGAPFRLAAAGRVETALMWKNMIATTRTLSLYVMGGVLLAVFLAAIVFSFWLKRTTFHPLALVVGIQASVFAGILCMMGPELFRSDLRNDLKKVDLLKTWPIGGRSLILGEILVPSLMTFFLQALALAAAVPFLSGALGVGGPGWALAALGALILAIPVNLIVSVLFNAALLAFPAWHLLGPDRARGIEAMGQQIVATFLRMFALAAALLPSGLIVGFGVHFTYPAVGMIAVPIWAAVAAAPLLIEIWMGVEAVGWMFDRFDPSKELDIAT